MRFDTAQTHRLHHHRKRKPIRTTVIFEQNSKLLFTSVWYNISKKKDIWSKMKIFSEKALQSLNGYYVYALIDPRTDKVFYIGKGVGNRVFNHEVEGNKSPDSEKIKLQTISSIENAGLNVKRVIVNWGLTESEAFVAEASLINLLNFTSDIKLSNIVAGHHVHESLTVEDFELRFGAEHLKEEDIKHNILVIKINRLFHWNMTQKELYDATRGNWKVSISRVRREIDYVFAVYNQLVVAVYKPDEWHYVRDMIDVPRPHEFKNGIDKNSAARVYFISKNHESLDESQQFYLHKSIAELKVNQSAQNPVTYLIPKRELTLLSTESIPVPQSDNENNIYEEPNFDYVIIKTTIDKIRECGGSVYEATRRAWKVGERIKQHKYVLSVVNKVVQAVYTVDNWRVIESGEAKGRYEFFGVEAIGTNFDSLIGKTIPAKYRVKGMASPVVYKKC